MSKNILSATIGTILMSLMIGTALAKDTIPCVGGSLRSPEANTNSLNVCA